MSDKHKKRRTCVEPVDIEEIALEPHERVDAKPRQWNVLNLGAGVQSSYLAIKASRGEVLDPETGKPTYVDFAVFADTQAEPESVMKWLDFLETQVDFPIYRVTKGNLTDDCLTPSKATHRSKNYKEGEEYMRRIIPAFGIMPNGEKTAAIGRICTADYKIVPIERKIKEICGIKRGQKNVTVTQWIGISWDEMQRAKISQRPWTQLRYPLLEVQIRRHQIIKEMEEMGYNPPRSACIYCPFHSDSEWRRLKNEEPEEFEKAIDFDRKIRALGKKDRIMKMEVYLHNSCKPLDKVDFDSDEDKGQMVWDFQSECEGMCGV